MEKIAFNVGRTEPSNYFVIPQITTLIIEVVSSIVFRNDEPVTNRFI